MMVILPEWFLHESGCRSIMRAGVARMTVSVRNAELTPRNGVFSRLSLGTPEPQWTGMKVPSGLRHGKDHLCDWQ
jgi:hypothetical protein